MEIWNRIFCLKIKSRPHRCWCWSHTKRSHVLPTGVGVGVTRSGLVVLEGEARQVEGRHLHGVVLLPLEHQVLRRPPVWGYEVCAF